MHAAQNYIGERSDTWLLVRFENVGGCLDTYWQSENVIVTGTNKYFGWPYGVKSHLWWKGKARG